MPNCMEDDPPKGCIFNDLRLWRHFRKMQTSVARLSFGTLSE